MTDRSAAKDAAPTYDDSEWPIFRVRMPPVAYLPRLPQSTRTSRAASCVSKAQGQRATSAMR
jgi:hypothetical protein